VFVSLQQVGGSQQEGDSETATGSTNDVEAAFQITDEEKAELCKELCSYDKSLRSMIDNSLLLNYFLAILARLLKQM